MILCNARCETALHPQESRVDVVWCLMRGCSTSPGEQGYSCVMIAEKLYYIPVVNRVAVV